LFHTKGKIFESDIGRFKPVITADDEVLEFPELKEFRDILNTW
jgi:hypothetical protein